MLPRVSLLASVLVLVLVLVSCDKQGGEKAAVRGRAAAPSSAVNDAAVTGKKSTPSVGGALKAPAVAKVSILDFSPADVPQTVEIKGRLLHGLRFSDANGDNFVVFSKKKTSTRKNGGSKSEYLTVRHVAVDADGVAKELRLVRDKVQECELDLFLEVDKKSLEVTDLDDDGIGEVGFGYEMICTGDISPTIYKLLMIENGDKYIIRGTTTREVPGDGVMGGEMKVDKSFRNGPKPFRSHAKRRWKKLTRR